MRKHLIGMVVLLVILSATAHAYNFYGLTDKPSWWHNDPMWISADWELWNGLWTDRGGVMPDGYVDPLHPGTLEIGGEWPAGTPYPLNATGLPVTWSGNATTDQYVNLQGETPWGGSLDKKLGVLVEGDNSDWSFDVSLGNAKIVDWTKQLYIEVRLDNAPPDLSIDEYSTFWHTPTVPNSRFWYEMRLSYDTDKVPDEVIPDPIDSGVADLDANGFPLVWWAEFSFPQTWYEDFVFHFNTDSTTAHLGDFRVTGLIIGSSCEPEPSSVALMALACCLPVGFAARRRKKTKK